MFQLIGLLGFENKSNSENGLKSGLRSENGLKSEGYLRGRRMLDSLHMYDNK